MMSYGSSGLTGVMGSAGVDKWGATSFHFPPHEMADGLSNTPAPEAPPEASTSRNLEDPEKQQIEEVAQDVEQPREGPPKLPELKPCPAAFHLHQLTPGYAKLAGRMGRDISFNIFRRFSALNAQNLLYLQAELVHFEMRLRDLEAINLASDNVLIQDILFDWPTLEASIEECNKDGSSGLQLLTIQQIRPLLKEYNETLLTLSRLELLEAPNTYDVSALNHFLCTMQPMGIIDRTRSVWGSKREGHLPAPDLVSIAPRRFEDSASQWVTHMFLKYITRLTFNKLGHRVEAHDGLVGYRVRHLLRITVWLATVLAAVLPVVSIVSLYYVKSIKVKFGIIGAFNLLVSSCLTVFTNAKRTDVFAVTAAFAALQVVFVGVNER